MIILRSESTTSPTTALIFKPTDVGVNKINMLRVWNVWRMITRM